jgi:aminomethyltransferase
LEVDYTSVEKALIPSQKYSPFEISLGWTVDLKKEHFIGSKALREESQQGPWRQIVGLEVNLPTYERLFQEASLPPQIPLVAWRGGAPIYYENRQVGHATTGGWSPTLKKYIALATVLTDYAKAGNQLQIEVTVEHERKTSAVTVTKLPFFDPPRKRAMSAS